MNNDLRVGSLVQLPTQKSSGDTLHSVNFQLSKFGIIQRIDMGRYHVSFGLDKATWWFLRADLKPYICTEQLDNYSIW